MILQDAQRNMVCVVDLCLQAMHAAPGKVARTSAARPDQGALLLTAYVVSLTGIAKWRLSRLEIPYYVLLLCDCGGTQVMSRRHLTQPPRHQQHTLLQQLTCRLSGSSWPHCSRSMTLQPSRGGSGRRKRHRCRNRYDPTSLSMLVHKLNCPRWQGALADLSHTRQGAARGVPTGSLFAASICAVPSCAETLFPLLNHIMVCVVATAVPMCS